MELIQVCTISDAEIVSVVFPFQLFYIFLCFFAQGIKFVQCHLVHPKVNLIPLCIAEKWEKIFKKRSNNLPHLMEPSFLLYFKLNVESYTAALVQSKKKVNDG